MSDQPRTSTKRPRTGSLDCLTVDRRRRLLRVLAERSSTVTVRTLATEVVASDRDGQTESIPEADVERVRLRLHHVDLPKLADAGLVAWDEDAGTVAARDHPLRDDPLFEYLLGITDDERAAVLADERYREILTAFGRRTDRLSRSELARIMVASDDETATDAAESLEVDLHHTRLPKLAEAGLVDYDLDAAEVTYTGPRALLAAAVADDPRRAGDADGSQTYVKIP